MEPLPEQDEARRYTENEPLGTLRLTTRTLAPNRPLPPEPVIRRVVGMIDRQLAYLERMVGDFIDMARIEAGELELRLELCDLRPIVEQSVELFAAASPRERFDLVLPEIGGEQGMGAALGAGLVDALASALVGRDLEHDVDDVREECTHFVSQTDAQLLAHVHADVVVIVDRHSPELGQRALHDPQVAAAAAYFANIAKAPRGPSSLVRGGLSFPPLA